MDQCPYCYQRFQRVKTHLRFCKQKPGQVVHQTISRSEDSRNQQCPYCKEVFIRVKSHLPYCKRKPEYDACNGNTRREVSSGQQHQQGQQRCPHCNELFTRLKTHLHYCKRNPEYDACKGSTRREVTSDQQHQQGQQRCPHCNDLFTRLKTHLQYCKRNPGYDACNGRTRRDVSSGQQHQQGQQRCPRCNELFTRLKTHLHYCKQKSGKDERKGKKQKPASGELEIGCQKTDTSGKQKCSNCHRLFKCLNKHLPYCKPKPEQQILQMCRGASNSSDSSGIRQRAHLEHKLKKRLQDTRVDQRQPPEVIETIDKIKSAVLETLKDDFPSTRWEAINSGSYYELVKVSLTKVTPESLSFLNKSLTFATRRRNASIKICTLTCITTRNSLTLCQTRYVQVCHSEPRLRTVTGWHCRKERSRSSLICFATLLLYCCFK